MKFLLLFLALLSLFGVPFSEGSNIEESKVNEVLSKVLEKLNSLKNIRYDYKREINYFSENYHNKLTGDIFLDFQNTGSIIDFKYQMKSGSQELIFNGTEEFTLDKKKKTIKVNAQPNKSTFDRISLFYNSIITLKNAIPSIISDETLPKAVNDTIINNIPLYLVKIIFNNKNVIDHYLGKTRSPLTLKKNIIYEIIIDKKSSLPIKVVQKNNINKDFVCTTFANIRTNTSSPSALSWYYSSYTNEYKSVKPKKMSRLISVGKTAPGWKLVLYGSGKEVTLNDFKGDIVLLDFWIKNCGPCIESVPHLNALQEEFKHQPFQILSINSYDTKENIKWFCNKYKPYYNILMNGKDVAEKYGVWGFPTVVLIDKQGKILYSSPSFDQSKVESLIREAL